jgi:hypothetical protein
LKGSKARSFSSYIRIPVLIYDVAPALFYKFPDISGTFPPVFFNSAISYRFGPVDKRGKIFFS